MSTAFLRLLPVLLFLSLRPRTSESKKGFVGCHYVHASKTSFRGTNEK